MKKLAIFIVILALFTTGCLKNGSSDESTLEVASVTAVGELRGQIMNSGAPAAQVPVTIEKAASIQAAPQRTEANYSTYTDDNGYYVFTNVPEGDYFMKAEQGSDLKVWKQNVTVRQKAITDLGQLQLTPTGSITGSVTRYGLALANTQVFILGTSYCGSTNSSGQYVLSGIPAGTYSVTAIYLCPSSGETYMASKSVTVTGGTTASCETIAVMTGFYALSGPNENLDLTNAGKGWSPSSTSFHIYFSQLLYSSDNLKSAISISPNDKNYVISATASGNEGSFSFAASPGYPAGFNYGTTYTVTVSTSLKDKNGTTLPTNYTFSFTTASAVNSAIAMTSPANGKTDIQTNTSVMIYFTSLMDRASVEESLTFKNASGTAISHSTSWVSDSAKDLDIITISPTGDSKNNYSSSLLAENETYTVSVGGKTFGGTSITTYSFSFTTQIDGIYITSNTTWDASRTVSVPVYITPGVTLTINPGVTVTFSTLNNKTGAIYAHPPNAIMTGGGHNPATNSNPGILKANGTSANHIILKNSNSSDSYIYIGKTSSLAYCDLEGCVVNTYAAGTTATDIFTITNSYFNNSMILVNDSVSSAATSTITYNKFRYALTNLDYGIKIMSGTTQISISNNDIQDNYYGIYITSAANSNIKLTSNNIYNNTYYNIYISAGTTMTASGNYLGTSTAATLAAESYINALNTTVPTGWYTSSAVTPSGPQ